MKVFTSNKRTYQVGEHIRVSEGQILMDRGYARVLTKAEAGVILEEYVKYAEILFPQPIREKKNFSEDKRKAVEQGRIF